MNYRKPFVAGNYYPDQQAPLKSQLRVMLRDIASIEQQPQGIIVPHGGFQHSGEIAAQAYAPLIPFADNIKNVIVLGSSHRYPVSGCVVPSHQGFITPLGKITVDQTICQHLIESQWADSLDVVHQQEHSIEVQLPFLQHCINDFKLIPIIVGQINPKALTPLLTYLANLPNSLIVISVNLSHYSTKAASQQIDSTTIANIEQLNSEFSKNNSFEAHVLQGFIEFVASKQGKCQLLKHQSASDAHQDDREVVGYASFACWF